MSLDHGSDEFSCGLGVALFVRWLLRSRNEPDSSPETAEQIKEEFCYVYLEVVKEFTRFDQELQRLQKYVVEQQPGGPKVTVDVGYEKFLASGIFFNPRFYSSDSFEALTHCRGYSYPKLSY